MQLSALLDQLSRHRSPNATPGSEGQRTFFRPLMFETRQFRWIKSRGPERYDLQKRGFSPRINSNMHANIFMNQSGTTPIKNSSMRRHFFELHPTEFYCLHSFNIHITRCCYVTAARRSKQRHAHRNKQMTPITCVIREKGGTAQSTQTNLRHLRTVAILS